MNPELQRQNNEAMERLARINRTAPVCRAIAAPIKRERPKLPRGAPPPKKTPPMVEAIEHEHRVRIRCIRDAYEAEKSRHRATFAATMRECNKREHEDMAACVRTRMELLREAKDLGASQ